ncbi:type IV secretion system protein [[Acidovorax] ebreus]|uniref:type IV secretion system protein n=1 Tax=Diaphorobacter sp. LI3 TaxID=2952886 RepID=UPI002064EB9C|nr:type IV secretion system protein [Diaphorobacter sp. LI3]
MALGDIAGLLDPLIEKAAGMSGAFVPLGQTFLGLALVINIALAVFDWWMGSVSGALSRVTRGALVLILPLALLLNWAPWMQTTTKFFTTELTAPIVNAAGVGNAGEAVKTAIEKLNTAMFPSAQKDDGKSAWSKAWEFVTGDASIGKALVGSLTQALFDLILFFISGLVAFALLLALYGPLLALQLGVIFGPLLVAWLPWQPMSHLFHNWLRFMLANGFSLVIGVTLATLGAGVIGDFATQMATIGKDPNLPWYMELMVRAGAFMSSAAVIIFVAFYLMRAEDIASSLIGGGGSGSGAVASGIMHGAKNLRGEVVRKAGKPTLSKK